jgi:imidazole glycerol-phosphate synthase subunit HisF
VLKRRIIATLIVRDGIVVQSINFRKYLPVGKPDIAIEYLNMWGIDEIVILDISASVNHALKCYGFIEEITRSCFVPVTVGGGVNSIEDMRALMAYGADKIAINSYCFSNPGFISKAASIFGNQCIMVSIDVVGNTLLTYRVYNAAKNIITNIDPIDWAKNVESKGAGEIYLTSVDRDGSKNGFDLELIDMVASNVKIPVIASGGAGNPKHIFEVLNRTNASAVSAANFFHFSEHSVITTKAHLLKNNIDIRLNTHANYANHTFDEDIRLKKHPDGYLQNLLFEKIEKEII